MFEMFTENAKRAIMLSQDETIALGYDYIGTEQLLLGLIGVPDSVAGQVLGEHGVTLPQARHKAVELLTAAGVTGTGGRATTDALASIGIDVDEVKRRMDDTFGPGQFQFPSPQYSPEAKKMLEMTVHEAQELGSIDSIDTEHMLLGMLDADGDSIGVRVLTELAVDTATLRQQLLARAGAQQP